MKVVEIPVNEFYGDNMLQLGFPENWEVKVAKMEGHDSSPMTEEEIRESIQHPIGSKSISELAKGKKGRIAITCDDLQRPTPAHAVIPYIIEELKSAGISERQIFILSALGTHYPMNTDQFARKVGWDIVRKFDCVNHNPFEHFHDLGRTSRGTPLLINKEFVKADLRISICGVKVHYFAGSGGSGKTVIPGVSWINAISWNHRVVAGMSKYRAWKIKGNDPRDDMQEAARMANLDVTVNCTVNGKRELIGLHVGDLDDAWLEAVKFCYMMHSTKVNDKADIVVLNTYPLAHHGVYNWGLAESVLKEGGTVVAIKHHPLGTEITHYHEERRRHLKRLAGYPEEKGVNIQGHPEGIFTANYAGRPWPVKKAGRVMVFAPTYSKRDVLRLSPKVEWFTDWDQIIKELSATYSDSAKVIVYPYASLQFNPEEYSLQI